MAAAFLEDYMEKFHLTEEHIKLISKLNFKTKMNTVYDDAYIPAIDVKRPFGNSGAEYSVCEILNLQMDAYGEYTQEAKEKAEMLLIELPVALEIVTSKHTFEPGEYEIERYGAYFQYICVKNFHFFKNAFQAIEEKLCSSEDDLRQLEQIKSTALSNTESNPYKLLKSLRFYKETEFLSKVIAYLEEWSVNKWIETHNAEDYCQYCPREEECPKGMVCYGGEPIEPSCVGADLNNFLHTDSILEKLLEGEE